MLFERRNKNAYSRWTLVKHKITQNQFINEGGKSNDSRFACTARSLRCCYSSDNQRNRFSLRLLK